MAKALSQIGILIIDDDTEICDYMAAFLTQAGFQVKAINNPHLALDEVRSGLYHLIILDLMMPKIDGIELLQQIHKIDTEVAVIIFTDFPSLETAVNTMKLDVVDYIKKPFTPEEFRSVLARVMKRKGLARSPEEELHKVIGSTIRFLRKARGLTLKQMARRTALSVSLLSQIERAESSASISSLYKIALALDTRITRLFGDF